MSNETTETRNAQNEMVGHMLELRERFPELLWSDILDKAKKLGEIFELGLSLTQFLEAYNMAFSLYQEKLEQGN